MAIWLFCAVLLTGFSGSLAGNCCSSGGSANDPGCDRECNPSDLPNIVEYVLRQTDISNAAGTAQRISQEVTDMYYRRTHTHFPVVVNQVSLGIIGSPQQGGFPTYEESTIQRISITQMTGGGSYMARNIEGRDGIYRNAMVWFYDVGSERLDDSVINGFQTAAATCVNQLLATSAATSLNVDKCAKCVASAFSPYGTNQGVLVVRTSTSSQGQANRAPQWHNMSHILNYSAGGVTVFMLAHNR